MIFKIQDKATGAETIVTDFTLGLSGAEMVLDMPITQDREAFSMIVDIKAPETIRDTNGASVDPQTKTQKVDHGPIQAAKTSIFGTSLSSGLGGVLITGITAGSIGVILGSLCGLNLIFFVKFIWFLELISYFVFINANFGSVLS